MSLDLTFQISVPLVAHQDVQTMLGQLLAIQNGPVVYSPVPMVEHLDLAITLEILVAQGLDMM
jgi:hypothetical protein